MIRGRQRIRVRLTLLALGGMIAGQALSIPTALAHDHRPPRVTAQIQKERYAGRFWSSSWAFRVDEQICGSSDDTGPGLFRKGELEFDAPAVVRIIFHKAQRPNLVKVVFWRRISEEGFPKGRLYRPKFHLKEVRSKGADPEWMATFKARREGDYFVQVDARWADVEGCNHMQEGTWAFRLAGR